MDINAGINEYRRLYTEIFEHGSSRLRSFFPRNVRNGPFEERLRYIIKDIVHRRLPRKYGPKTTNLGASEEFAYDEDRCRT